jgi:hypothetical protein
MTHRYLQHLHACRLFLMAAMVAVATTLSFAPATADAAVTVPVNAKHFDGAFTITGFTTQTVNGVQQLAAVGTLVGSEHKGPRGDRNPVAIGGVTVPVTITSPTCPILHLDLGPLNLDLLGLQVDLSEVILDITAVPGAGNLLGNLLCSVAGLLDPGSLQQLVNLLNQIIDLLG